MVDSGLQYHELTDVHDPLFLNWLDAIQMGFPPDEQMLASFFLRILFSKECNEKDAMLYHLLAVLGSDRQMVGLLMYQLFPDQQVCYLWYIWVDEMLRGQGIGSAAYLEMIRRTRAEMPDVRALVYEIDRPDQAQTKDVRIEAERRIEFYRRLGMKIATNLVYHQSVERRDQPMKQMYLCIHSLLPVTGDEAYQLLNSIFGRYIEDAATAVLE